MEIQLGHMLGNVLANETYNPVVERNGEKRKILDLGDAVFINLFLLFLNLFPFDTTNIDAGIGFQVLADQLFSTDILVAY